MANPFRDMSVVMQALVAAAIAVVLVLVGVVRAVFASGAGTRSSRQSGGARTKLSQEVTQLQVYKQRYGELKQQMDALIKQLETLKTIVPEEKEVDEFIRHGAGSGERVERADPAIDGAGRSDSKEYHYEMPFEAQADGPYFNVLDFSRRLSRLSRIINVGDLQLDDPGTASSKETKYPIRPGTTVTGIFTITTYFTKQADTTPAAAGATKAPGAESAGEKTVSRNERAMRLGKILVVASLLAAAGSGMYAQTKTTPTPPPAKTGTAKAPAQTSTKKAAAAPKATPGTPAAAPAESEQKVARRDPFESLTTPAGCGGEKRGEFASGQTRVADWNIAVGWHRQGPQRHDCSGYQSPVSYLFLRDGDQLYDGRVEKIGMDSVSFHEIGKDAFGKASGAPGKQENLLQCRRTAMKTNWPAFRIGCLIVASMMLGGTRRQLAAQAPAGASTNAAVISSVAITQAPAASRNPRGRSGKAGRTRGTDAESGAIGAGFRQRDDGRAEDVDSRRVGTGADVRWGSSDSRRSREW